MVIDRSSVTRYLQKYNYINYMKTILVFGHLDVKCGYINILKLLKS